MAETFLPILIHGALYAALAGAVIAGGLFAAHGALRLYRLVRRAR